MAPLVLDDFKKVFQFFPIVIAALDELKPVMLLSNGISCPYLKDNRCSIYEKRPPACKIYPFSPWYEKILLDLSCKGVGTKGDLLPLKKEEFIKSPFYEERFENIKEKLNKTKKWLSKKDLIKIGSIKNIEIYKTDSINDEYDRMHQNSLEFLKNYQKTLEI
jgi:Fe-S-cluster containining protein